MGRHRKRNRSIAWDYAAIWSWPFTVVAGFAAGFFL